MYYAIVAALDRHAHLHAHVCMSVGVILHPICVMIDVPFIFKILMEINMFLPFINSRTAIESTLQKYPQTRFY